MDESNDELISDWCNQDLDIKCSEAVDKFEQKSCFALIQRWKRYSRIPIRIRRKDIQNGS